nr:class I SAM-dependent methyltransferase [Rugamonas sp. CCM 8940]
MIERWRGVSFVEEHGVVAHLLPDLPGRVLDIGAGIGNDAAAFAAMGHSVVAVEPTSELRLAAIALHPSARIEWLDDSLPELAVLRTRSERFDVVVLQAVWMHLDQAQRARAMPLVAAQLADGGTLLLSLRHGPVPAGRRMFAVTAAETIALAGAQGLAAVLNVVTPSVQALNQCDGVSWTRLVFRRAPAQLD